MEVGQPGTPAPPANALSKRRLGYTEALGLPELHARIARYTAERYDLSVAPERVVVT